ncbi:carbonic anhydrase family protein [Flagellimonas allohymeniacidonis]|uniref:Carbonic anhydrase n=1 Tax=Flagellimonas allohymeniacidonis TaxID=2517819 RepID=A0A4Q8QB49_9FLAO|nr:carbonic anhydrase family protein [Allomuricauda hymeniacidonis]TAI47501.1 carbonic anhydrase family protein [Allomuricauda hymeniacidonis]
MKAIKILPFLLPILLSSCVERTHKKEIEQRAVIEPDSVYVHEDGTVCHAQSPINILSSEQKDGKHNITFSFKDEINSVENLGHTVQVDFKIGSTVEVDGETFEFKQAHFHTPSEHLIDGVTYPMEMHVVNTLKGQEAGQETEFLVLGFLFKMGDSNPFVSHVLNSVPEEENAIKEVDLGEIQFSDFIEEGDDLLGHYYHYKGSLTTPPYSETVRWYVTKNIYEASPNQITSILNIEGVNARHIQGINDRTIETE